MNLLHKYFQYSLGPDIYDMLEILNLKLDFIIEAGCHDGSDTERLLMNLNEVKIFAFEPDSRARVKAESKLSRFIPKQLLVSPYALSNYRGTAFLVYSGVKGNGSTQISNKGSEVVETRTLDEVLPSELHRGLLWLDVEGHSVQVLSGATKTLKKIVMAKIEVQMHDMGPGRKADLFAVMQIMEKSGLVPIYGPIHPGYFGDVIFLKYDEIRLKLKIKSFVLKLQFQILHKLVYPKLNKPKKASL